MPAQIVPPDRQTWLELVMTAVGIVIAVLGAWLTDPALLLLIAGLAMIDGAQRAARARGERPE